MRRYGVGFRTGTRWRCGMRRGCCGGSCTLTSRQRLAVGDQVEPGETLGLCDSTGNSTGHHVHLDATPGGRYRSRDIPGVG